MAAMCFKLSLVSFVLVLCVMNLIRESYAKPPWYNSGVFTESADCQTDEELLDLCQRCAKLTKARSAYSTCCSTDLQARNWCSDYVYFGKGSYDFY